MPGGPALGSWGQRRRALIGPTVSTRPSSWTSRPPISARTARPPLRPGQQRRLGERLRLDRGVAERGRSDQPGPGRLAGRRVEQVMAIAAVAPLSRSGRSGRRWRSRRTEPEHVDPLPGQRMLDDDLIGIEERVVAADPDVAAAVDHEARVAAKAASDQVRGQPLADAAAVEPDAGRAARSSRPRRRPRTGARPSRAAGGRGDAAAAPPPGPRRAGRRSPPACRRTPRSRSPRAAPGRPGRRCGRPPRSRRRPPPASAPRPGPPARVGVQGAELAVGSNRDSTASNSADEPLEPRRPRPPAGRHRRPARRSPAGPSIPSRRRPRSCSAVTVPISSPGLRSNPAGSR